MLEAGGSAHSTDSLEQIEVVSLPDAAATPPEVSSPSSTSSTSPSFHPAVGLSLPSVLSSSSSHPEQLRKVLGWPQLVALGVGCTIGAGIFVVTGQVASQTTGPALFLSYIVSGLACLCAALCYAEFAAMAPSAGSAYSYARATMGELVGWIIGWDLTLEYTVAASAVAKGWSVHANELLQLMGSPLPAVLSNAPLSASFQLTGAVLDLPAVVITVCLTVVLVRGIRESAMLNNVMVAVKVSVVVLVIIAGSTRMSAANFSPFLPFGFAGISLFGYTVFGSTNANGDAVGVMAGAAIVFFAYIGFDAVSCQAEECRNPQRDLPIGIIGSLLISTALYVVVSIVLVGMVPYQQIDPGAPFSVAFKQQGMVWAEALVAVGALTGITSVLLVTMLGQPRILLAMSRDKLLPEGFFAYVHPVYRTPVYSTMLTGAIVAVTSGLIPLSVLVELVSIGTLFAFTLVSCCVLLLRRTQPLLRRPFLCPWVPFVPALGAFLCFMLMLSLPASNWWRLIVWLLVGLVIYYSYGRKQAARRGGDYSLGRAEDEEEAAHGKGDVDAGEEGEGRGYRPDAAVKVREEGEDEEDEGKDGGRRELGAVKRIVEAAMVEMEALTSRKIRRRRVASSASDEGEEGGQQALQRDAGWKQDDSEEVKEERERLHVVTIDADSELMYDASELGAEEEEEQMVEAADHHAEAAINIQNPSDSAERKTEVSGIAAAAAAAVSASAVDQHEAGLPPELSKRVARTERRP